MKHKWKQQACSGLLAVCMILTLAPAALAADASACISCGHTDGTHAETCRFACPTEGCTVTYGSSGWSHSSKGCPYAAEGMYCAECGYLAYREEDDDYFHADDCTIGHPEQGNPEIGDDSPPAEIANQYKVDGVTYFGVDSDHFDDSTRLFIQDMLATKSKELGNQSTAALWQHLGFAIQKHKGRGTSTGKFRTQFNDVLAKSMAYATGSTGSYSANLKSGDNNYNTKSNGLTYANSMASAAEAMENLMFTWYRGAGGGRNDKYGDADDAAIAKNETLWDNTDPDDVFWILNGAYKTSGTNKKGHYQALGMLFSNFKITTILPEDDGNFYKTSASEDTPETRTYASNVKNLTGTQVSAQQEITNTTSATASSEIGHSEEYGFEESLTLGVEKSIGTSWKVNAEIGFKASQVLSNSWSKGESTTAEQSTSYNVSVDLPPYTNVMMTQRNNKATETTTYRCPVALSFTVTVVEYTLDPSSNNASCRTQVLATFGGNARKNLLKRGVVEQTLTDPDGVKWSDLYAANSGLENIVDARMTATAPMASAGAKFEAELNTMTSEVSGLAPVYALNAVKTVNDIREYHLTSGEYLYVDTIALEGLNRQNAPYYGFNAEKGRWVLVDADGTRVSDSDIAMLETNPVTGFTKLKAGNAAGTLYLKYLINEDCYATAENPTRYAKNNLLEGTAMIEVNVSPIPFTDGKITVSGKLEGIAGDPARAIEGADGLAAVVQDSTGKELSRPVVWDAQELENKGVKIEDNQISFTQEGTFHVRATSGQTRSGWYEVAALPARKLASIVIPETAVLDYKDGRTLDLNSLTVYYKDQYGADWTEIPTLTWNCTAQGVTLDENHVLTVPAAGTYTVTASAGDLVSNVLTVTVTDSRLLVSEASPAEKSLPTSGGGVEFTLTGKNLMDGIPVKAAWKDAAGQDTATIEGATTGTDTEQKVTLTFPENTADAAQTYAVSYFLTGADGEYAVPFGTVTVARKASGGGGGSGSGGTASYTLTFETNGGSSIAKVSKSRGSTIDLSDYTTAKDGYTFVGWYTDKELTRAADRVELTADTTVYAKWMEEVSSGDESGFPFMDVGADDWFRAAVEYAYGNGIMNGTSAATFSPDRATTRGMTVAILHRLEGAPSTPGAAFDDVAADAYYAQAVAWAAQNAIVSGYGNSRFGPDDPVTREQMAVILMRYAAFKGHDLAGEASLENYTDGASTAAYAQDAMRWAIAAGILSGKGEGVLDPKGLSTRAQTAQMFLNFLGNVSET